MTPSTAPFAAEAPATVRVRSSNSSSATATTHNHHDVAPEPKLCRAERRKRTFAAAAELADGNDRDTGSSKDSGIDTCMPTEKHAPVKPLSVPSLDELASFSEIIAKRARTLRKLWAKIQKYEEMDKAALNKDQVEALSRKTEVQWSLHELDELGKHAAQLEKDEAARMRRIRQELDREHAAAIADVREEERRAADLRTVEAVRSVFALLSIVPGLRDGAAPCSSPLDDVEIGALDFLKDLFLDKAHPERAADAELQDILSQLDAGADIPVVGHSVTYAHLKLLLRKVLYPQRIPSPLSSDTAEHESELLGTAKAADQYTEEHGKVADVRLGQTSSLHDTAEEICQVAEAIHHQQHPLHCMQQDAPLESYAQMDPQHFPLTVPMMEILPEAMAAPVIVTPQGIQFGSLGISADNTHLTESEPQFSTVEEVEQELTTLEPDMTTSLVQNYSHTLLVVDDQTASVATHTVSVSDVPNQAGDDFVREQQGQQHLETQVDASLANASAVDHGAHAHRERQNRPTRRFRPNNATNRPVNGGGFYHQHSSPRDDQGAAASGQFQRDNDGDSNWQTRPARHPRQNRPQQGSGNGDAQQGGLRQGGQGGGNGPHRGGYRGGYRGGGGFRGGYRGGRGGSGHRGGGGPGKNYGGPAQQNAPADNYVGA